MTDLKITDIKKLLKAGESETAFCCFWKFDINYIIIIM
ncbi:hypothetical protein COXBURSA331_A2194 [Coxiella burnetii RSA 331]|nr:hypothetical protein COXBURSA331_A2194 [Coxiella burnetii RSA 331]EDR35653.1 hypothetical protein COXBURSA334_0053 [Coxiella burnetii Q321]